MHDLEVPLRRDGTPKVFFYDREGQHMIHLDRAGEMWAIGFDCKHKVDQR